MPISMYEASVPVFVRMLGNGRGMLGKAEVHGVPAGIDPRPLLRRRLAPDMFPLARQVQIAIDGARGAAARLAGLDPADPEAAEFAVFDRGFDADFPPDAESIAELCRRIEAAVDYLHGLPREAIDAAADRAITLTRRDTTRRFTGRPFLLGYVLPNLYFHLAITYAILRSEGIALGKADFEGPPVYAVDQRR